MDYIFTLKFSLTDHAISHDELAERLGAAGCEDALIGLGLSGRIALEFTREASSADEAIRSAVKDAMKAVPSMRLIEITPDLVGLTEVAEVVGISRQAVRKLMLTNPSTFPTPIHEGKSSLYHLEDILKWLKGKGNYSIKNELLETAQAALKLNIKREVERYLV